jgi:RNase P subunit RPR2
MSESPESVAMAVSMILQPVAMRTHCEACNAPVYANVFHKCGQMYPPPSRPSATYQSDSMGFPPEVRVSQVRTNCEACQAPLDPTVMHKCAGNEEWKPNL